MRFDAQSGAPLVAKREEEKEEESSAKATGARPSWQRNDTLLKLA